MTDPRLAPRLQSAIEHHAAGRLQQAEVLYRQILHDQPGNPDALHLLGVVALQVGQFAVAERLISDAIARNPTDPTYHNHLGSVLLELDRPEESAARLREAIRLDPRMAEAHSNLGNALKKLNRMDEAIAAYRQAIALRPDFADAYSNLGAVYAAVGRSDEALAAYDRATALNPRFATAWQNLGNALAQQGRMEEAVNATRKAVALSPQSHEALYRLGVLLAKQGAFAASVEALANAIRIKPDFAEALCELGAVLPRLGRHDESVKLLREAIRVRPDYFAAHLHLANVLKDLKRREEAINVLNIAHKLRPDAYEVFNNLGVIYYELCRMDESVNAYRRGLELNPDSPEAMNNLGNALMKQGRVAEAIASLRNAIKVRPEYSGAHSNLLYAMHLRDASSAREIFEAHRGWARLHAEPLETQVKAHDNDPTPGRRLRIGFVSADLRDHPVGRFLLPLLEQLDRAAFEVFCYSGVVANDAISQRLHAATDVWRSVAGISDSMLLERIRADRIDILIDLSGHTANNRLLVFARKPAPVQMTYLGYPGTTGLRAIDYRITDRHADPDGAADAFHSERLIRLNRSFICYRRFGQAPEPGPTPALKNGFVTFGSFNNWAKVSPRAMRAWARLLNVLPQSRLLVKAMSLNDDATRQIAREALAHHGVPIDRVEIVAPEGTYDEHLRSFRRMDVALDTFPYAGTTTTCEALDMGVPVVTLAGSAHVERMGVSLLKAAGCERWIAHSEDQYIEIASNLASDLDRLSAIRAGLAETIARSPLCDAKGLAAEFGRALREAWKSWCDESRMSVGELVDRGNALHQRGALRDAEACYRKAVTRDPGVVQAHSNLGVTLAALRRPAEAVESYRAALALRPGTPQTLSNLGNALIQLGATDEAIERLNEAVNLSPKVAQYRLNLGNAYLASGQRELAIESFQHAVSIEPENIEALNNLAAASTDAFRASEALDALDRCTSINPSFAPAYANRGNALLMQGQVAEAIDSYRKAVSLDPSDAASSSNVLYAMHLRDDASPQERFEAHVEWAGTFASGSARTVASHANDRSPDRRLRIGYVSADLRDHPVGRFMLPLLESRNREAFEVYCYAGAMKRDAVAEQIASASDFWRGVAALSTDALAELIRADRIDILVDLSGHTAGNRLTVFALKPAPVQVSYLGYPDTTGLPSIDWRITDCFADPEGEGDALHTERLWRLNHSLICYRPPATLPPISEPPAVGNGFVTFASFNNWSKVSPRTLRSWAHLLERLPTSRLLIKSLAMGDPSTRSIAAKAMTQADLPLDRIEFVSPGETHADHLASWGRADISLDTFPYAGTTTTCESLVMGVPVLTLAGQSHVSRMGVSILRTAGLDSWIASDEAHYVEIATAMARDPERLRALRSSLRGHVMNSPLCDAGSAAGEIESAYREMWKSWCAGG